MQLRSTARAAALLLLRGLSPPSHRHAIRSSIGWQGSISISDMNFSRAASCQSKLCPALRFSGQTDKRCDHSQFCNSAALYSWVSGGRTDTVGGISKSAFVFSTVLSGRGDYCCRVPRDFPTPGPCRNSSIKRDVQETCRQKQSVISCRHDLERSGGCCQIMTKLPGPCARH